MVIPVVQYSYSGYTMTFIAHQMERGFISIFIVSSRYIKYFCLIPDLSPLSRKLSGKEAGVGHFLVCQSGLICI